MATDEQATPTGRDGAGTAMRTCIPGIVLERLDTRPGPVEVDDAATVAHPAAATRGGALPIAPQG